MRDLDESSGVYAVTGYLAGLYEEVVPNPFGRVDADSPGLLEGIDISEGDIKVAEQ